VEDAARGDGEGGARRRRRRGGGGRGGERSERGERAPRDGQAVEGASPADAIESRAAELESARAPEIPTDVAPEHEPRRDMTSPPPLHEPIDAPARSPVSAPMMHAPVAFHAVSEHDQAEPADDAHRPNRRRHHGGQDSEQAPPLEMVETQAPGQVAPEAADEAPRRTKPRRRRSGHAAAEPLQLVETQNEEPRPDTPAE
jgi:hypothetical protein